MAREKSAAGGHRITVPRARRANEDSETVVFAPGRRWADETRARLAAIVLSSTDAIFTKDLDGIITSWNAGAERIFGYSAEEIVARNVALLAPPGLETEATDLTKRTIDGEQVSNLETRRVRKDGTVIDVSVTVSPIRDDSGKVTEISVIVRDITERKKAEDALREAALYTRSLIEASVDPLVTIGTDGKITDANLATEQATGLGRSKLIGTDFADYFTEPERARAAYLRVLKDGMLRDFSLILRSVSGATMNVLYNASTFVDRKGEVEGVFAAARDVTALGESEAATRNALLEMVDAIALTVEMRDPYTSGHQRRVAELASAIAERMGLETAIIEGARLGAMIHDIGKIHVPAEILSKPGILSKYELQMVQTHPGVGAEIVQGVHSPWPIAQMIAQHHERLDGSGYPDGLKGDEILLEARIIAVADVVEAMSSHRPYRPSLGVGAALDEITRGRGTLFDARVVDTCLALFEENTFEFSPIG